MRPDSENFNSATRQNASAGARPHVRRAHSRRTASSMMQVLARRDAIRLLIFAARSSTCSACHGQPCAGSRQAEAPRSLSRSPPTSRSRWAAASPHTGAAMNPASTMKLITTYRRLELWPTYHLEEEAMPRRLEGGVPTAPDLRVRAIQLSWRISGSAPALRALGLRDIRAIWCHRSYSRRGIRRRNSTPTAARLQRRRRVCSTSRRALPVLRTPTEDVLIASPGPAGLLRSVRATDGPAALAPASSRLPVKRRSAKASLNAACRRCGDATECEPAAQRTTSMAVPQLWRAGRNAPGAGKTGVPADAGCSHSTSRAIRITRDINKFSNN